MSEIERYLKRVQDLEKLSDKQIERVIELAKLNYDLQAEVEQLRAGVQEILDDCPDADPADGGQTLVVNKLRLIKLLNQSK